MSDDLKAFKISDQVKKQVDRPKGAPPAEAEAPQASAGFPRIEALVESDVPDVEGLAERQGLLEEMAKGKASNKDKASAKKAAAAYAKARALISYLLETKRKMTGVGPDTTGG